MTPDASLTNVLNINCVSYDNDKNIDVMYGMHFVNILLNCKKYWILQYVLYPKNVHPII